MVDGFLARLLLHLLVKVEIKVHEVLLFLL